MFYKHALSSLDFAAARGIVFHKHMYFLYSVLYEQSDHIILKLY